MHEKYQLWLAPLRDSLIERSRSSSRTVTWCETITELPAHAGKHRMAFHT
jgi:hypothetical protein